MTDLIGGTLSLFPVVVPLVSPHIQSGRAKGLAVFDTHRSLLLPEIPSVTEDGGVPGYTPTPVWSGFVAPARTPDSVVKVLSGYINTAMASPDVKARPVTLGAQPTR